MLKKLFRHGPEFIAGPDLSTGLNGWGEFPLLFIVQRFQISPAFQKETVLLGEVRQRILQPVKDLAQQPRAQFNAQKLIGELNPVADADIGCVLKNLQIRPVALHADDFGFEVFFPDDDIGHLILHDPVGKLNGHHVAVDPHDFSLAHCHKSKTPSLIFSKIFSWGNQRLIVPKF